MLGYFSFPSFISELVSIEIDNWLHDVFAGISF